MVRGDNTSTLLYGPPIAHLDLKGRLFKGRRAMGVLNAVAGPLSRNIVPDLLARIRQFHVTESTRAMLRVFPSVASVERAKGKYDYASIFHAGMLWISGRKGRSWVRKSGPTSALNISAPPAVARACEHGMAGECSLRRCLAQNLLPVLLRRGQ